MDVELHVEGMSCNHCEKAVKDALLSLDGVERVDVELETGKVNVSYDKLVVKVEAMVEAIEEQGYDVVQ